MPPKKDPSKSSSKESSSRESSRESTRETCCVCCQRVCTSKDEVLFCVGNCQQWIYRYCPSVSAKAYQRIRDNNTPFFSFGCYQGQSLETVAALTRTIQELRGEIDGLKQTISILAVERSSSTTSGNRGSCISQVRAVQLRYGRSPAW